MAEARPLSCGQAFDGHPPVSPIAPLAVTDFPILVPGREIPLVATLSTENEVNLVLANIHDPLIVADQLYSAFNPESQGTDALYLAPAAFNEEYPPVMMILPSGTAIQLSAYVEQTHKFRIEGLSSPKAPKYVRVKTTLDHSLTRITKRSITIKTIDEPKGKFEQRTRTDINVHNLPADKATITAIAEQSLRALGYLGSEQALLTQNGVLSRERVKRRLGFDIHFRNRHVGFLAINTIARPNGTPLLTIELEIFASEFTPANHIRGEKLVGQIQRLFSARRAASSLSEDSDERSLRLIQTLESPVDH